MIKEIDIAQLGKGLFSDFSPFLKRIKIYCHLLRSYLKLQVTNTTWYFQVKIVAILCNKKSIPCSLNNHGSKFQLSDKGKSYCVSRNNQ